jgi:hypothetical protein
VGETTARKDARQLALSGALVAAAILTITALGFFIFPGHTYLQQDTQIYVPMLEKLLDPALYPRELITSRPHLAWTAYDEAALLFRRISGLDFKSILLGEEFVFRVLGLWGVYLIARSMRLSERPSLLVAGIFALGATIVGPAVLTFEYEPVPRGFAIMLIFLAIGLTLSGRIGWASLAAAVAFLYHAPTVIPFWALFGVVAFRVRRWRAFAILAASVAILIVLSRIQPGLVERQPLFARISPFLERLQRMRASYNWVSGWNSEWFWHYGILVGLVIVAVYRIRDRLDAVQRIFILGLPLIGVLSVPVSYLALEQLKWSLIAQFQPARYVLFITAMAIIMGCAAAIDAATRQRYAETFVWLLAPFAIPALIVVAPPYKPQAALLVGVLAITATAVLALDRIRPRMASAAVLLLTAGAMASIPVFAGVRNYPELWTPGIQDVSNWARTHTDQAAVFAFPYAGKRLYPGLFRAEALRAVYVDWKAGGQANYFEDLARQWWARWESTMAPGSKPEYSSKDVDYIVVEREHADPSLTPVYANNEYVVYRTGAQAR